MSAVKAFGVLVLLLAGSWGIVLWRVEVLSGPVAYAWLLGACPSAWAAYVFGRWLR